MNVKTVVSRIALSFSVLSFIILSLSSAVDAQVTMSASDGFQIKIVKTTNADASAACTCLVKDVSKWWDPDHTYSGKSENLTMDLEKHCLYEKLPGGGFVRHMEIVFYQPDKTVRLSGGLGPLQEMGVAGALTFQFVPNGDKSNLELTYNVVGKEAQNLDKIAPAVESVLNLQLEHLRKYCDSMSNR